MRFSIAAASQHVAPRHHELDEPYCGSVSRRDEALGPDRLDVMAGGGSGDGVRRAAPRFDPRIDDIAGRDDLTLDHVLPDRVSCGTIDTWRHEIDRWQEVLAPGELTLRRRHVDGEQR